ncbi:MAG: hypothetical protein HZB25_14025 [Candidatus Eisenbacteria bacterium]|nr:hypothetical protein [Candidatus Eisenbacteria bacterium]
MKTRSLFIALGLVAVVAGLAAAYVMRGGTLGPMHHYVMLPAGTLGHVRLDAPVSSETGRVGDAVSGTLTTALSVSDTLALPEGTRVTGEVTSVSATGRGTHKASVGLRFQRMELADGQRIEIAARPFFLEAGGETTRDIALIGGGTVLGGVVGNLAGNTLVGAAVGAAAGTGAALHTRGDAVVLGQGTVLRMKLQQPVRVEVRKAPKTDT